MSYDNGITTSYTIDDNGRSDTINVTRTDIETNTKENLLSIDYDYDGVGNIIKRYDNQYEYDQTNRLTKAEIEGSFYTEKGNDIGYVLKDYAGNKGLDLAVAEFEEITLDYSSGEYRI